VSKILKIIFKKSALAISDFSHIFSENNVPNITLSEGPSNVNIVDGFWRVQIGVQSQIEVVAMDADGDDVTFSLTDDDSIMLPQGVAIHEG